MSILLVKINNREILTTKEDEFFKVEGDFNYIRDFITKKLEKELEFTKIVIEDKRKFIYYGEEKEVIVVNIEGFKVKNELKEVKILNLERDGIKEEYGNIIDEVFPGYKYYIGKNLKKYFVRNEKVKKIDKMDLIGAVIIATLIAFFMTYIDGSRSYYFGLWVTLISVIVSGYMFVVKKSKVKNYFGLFLFLSGIVLSITYSIFTNSLFRGINLFLTPILITYGMKKMVMEKEEVFIMPLVKDIIKTTFKSPFYKFKMTKGILDETSKLINKDKKNIRDIVIGIFISIPILIILGSILFGPDSTIFAIIDLKLKMFMDKAIYHLATIVVWIFSYTYLKGLFKLQRVNFERKKSVKIKYVNNIRLNTVLVMINLLYLVFTIAQITTVGQSYSEAAREVFFNLLLVMCINIGMIIRFHSQMEGLTRNLFSIMILFSIGMGVNSIINLKEYIEAYGLTRLRFLSTAFSVFLIVALVLIVINLFKRFNGWQWVVIVGVLMYLGLNYCNMDKIIIKNNIQRIESGVEKNDDSIYYLGDLSLLDGRSVIMEAMKNGAFDKVINSNGEDVDYISGYETLKYKLKEVESFHKRSYKWFEYNYYNN